MSNQTYRLSERILAILLAIVLIAGMVPASAYAAAPSTVTTDLASKTVTVGEYVEFNVTTTANDDLGKMVFGYFDFNGGDWSVLESLQYKESKDGNWYDLPQSAPFGPPSTGFPMSDATSTFRVKFQTAGTYSFNVSMKTVEGSTELCSLSGQVTATVKPSEITTDIAEKNFVVGTSAEFTFTSIPNGHADEMVFGKFTFSDWDAVEKLEYWGTTENMWLTLPKDVLFGPAGTGFPMTEATTRLQVTFSKAGSYTCTVALVKASDTNTALCSIEKEITVTETIPPVVDSITGNPVNWAKSATITGSVSDQGGSNVAKVVYSTNSNYMDTHTPASLTGDSYSFTVTANGTYYVWAVDGNGNVSEAQSIEINKIDITPPELDVQANPNDWTNDKVTVAVTASDANGVTVKYNTTDAFESATKLLLTDGKAEISVVDEYNGSYYVWAVDTAGNRVEKNVLVKIDKTKPIVAITTVPSAVWTNGNVTIEGTVADDDSNIDRLLLNTDLPIHEIIRSVGYENRTVFYRHFQEKNNMTPKEYRKSLWRFEWRQKTFTDVTSPLATRYLICLFSRQKSFRRCVPRFQF